MVDKNKIIIIALIAVIAVLLVGIVSIMHDGQDKQGTNITFKSKSTLTEGDSIKVKLTDSNGTSLSNQTVNITITDKDKSNSYYSVVTNEKGIGTLKLDKSPGKYKVTVSYGGSDNYSACNSSKTITVEEEVVEAEVESYQTTESSSPSDELYYDSEINVYYNGDGIVVDPDGQHSQGVGSQYSDLRDTRDRWERGEPVME